MQRSIRSMSESIGLEQYKKPQIYFLWLKEATIQNLFKLWWGLKAEEIAQAANSLGGITFV